jgi:hypothetical protein
MNDMDRCCQEENIPNAYIAVQVELILHHFISDKPGMFQDGSLRCGIALTKTFYGW